MIRALLRSFGLSTPRARGSAELPTEFPGLPPGPVRAVEAIYDAAQTTPDNRRHWQWADHLSAKAANSPDVRRILRSRARYECANNGYADGIATTLANDTIGKGATLQVNSDDESFNTTVETWWERWAKEVDLWEKLRLARRAKAVDGEAFILLVFDPGLQHPVKWNLEVIEADRIHTPYMPLEDPSRTDGIVFDGANPLVYHLLRQHPGDNNPVGAWEYDEIPAKFMFHWFTKKRPGELRGVSEFRASLRPLSELRRFAISTVKKRELQSHHTGWLEQQATGNVAEEELEFQGIAPFTEVDSVPGTWTALPDGVKATVNPAPDGTDPFEPVKKQCLSEAGRPWCMNYIVVACDSSDASFSAGKLDHRLYGRNIELEQDRCGILILGRLFQFWMYVANNSRAPMFPDDALLDWDATFGWQSFDDPDPEKTSNSDATDIASGIVSRTTVQIRRRLDPHQEEQRMAKERGLTVDQYRVWLREHTVPALTGTTDGKAAKALGAPAVA